MNRKTTLLAALLFSMFGALNTANATLAVLINNTSHIELSDLNQDPSDKNLISATIADNSRVTIGEGNNLDIPGGTRVGFYPNNGELTDLKIFSLIVTERHLPTEWRVNDDIILDLNCGSSGGIGASFIKFTIDGALEEGCRLNSDHQFEGPNYNVSINAGSKFRLTSNGDLIYGQKVSEGQLLLNEQLVSLLPEHPVVFHENLMPYFIFLNTGERIVLQTEFGETAFGQSVNEGILPTVFFESGRVSSGLFVGEDIQLPILALGELKSLTVSSNDPVRFHSDGSIYQISMKDTVSVTSNTYAKVTRVLTLEGLPSLTQTLDIQPEDSFVIPEEAQLLIENNTLIGFTHLEDDSLAFTYSIEESQVVSGL